MAKVLGTEKPSPRLGGLGAGVGGAEHPILCFSSSQTFPGAL